MNADKLSVMAAKKVVRGWVGWGDCLLLEKNGQGKSRNEGGGRRVEFRVIN